MHYGYNASPEEPEAEEMLQTDMATNPDQEDREANGPDWARLNKQFKRKSGLWAASDPEARLALLTMTVLAVQRVMQGFLEMSGQEWDIRQRQCRAEGRPRRTPLS